MSYGIPWRRMIACENSSSAVALEAKFSRYGPSELSAATSAPERRARISSRPM